MSRAIRTTCVYPLRLLAVAVICWSLGGCAAVVSSVALIPVQFVSDVIVQSAQTGFDMATANIRSAIEENP